MAYKPQLDKITSLKSSSAQVWNFLSNIDNFLSSLSIPEQNVFTLNYFVTASGTISYKNPLVGQALIVEIQQDSIGHNLVWGSNFLNAPNINSSPNSFTVAIFIGLSNTWLLASSNIASLVQTLSTPTPTLVFGTPGVAPTYGTQTCKLVQTGKQITLSIQLTLTNKGTGTGVISIQLSSIPLPLLGATCIGYILNSVGLTNDIIGLLSTGTSNIGLYQTGATGSVSIVDTNLSNTFSINISLSYQSI